MKRPLLLTILLLTLTACEAPTTDAPSQPPEAPTQEATTEAPDPAEAEPTAEDDDALEPGESAETEGGRVEMVKAQNIDETFKTGPFIMTVGTVSVATWIPNELTKPIAGDRDRVTMIGIAMKVENTSEETLSFHPNQAKLVVGQEQVNAEIFISDDVGGDFTGKVIKEGKVLFLLDTLPEDVNAVKYVVMGPNKTSDFSSVGEELTLEFAIE